MTDDAVDRPNAPGFAALGLSEGLVRTLADLGYEEPTPIQAAAIPPLLEGHDVLGQAATGTGKTAAFALPLVQNLQTSGGATPPAALVLAPTRELAMQVSQACYRYGDHRNLRVLPIYGGQPIHRQANRLHKGVDVVVGTPGRVVDLLGRGALVLDAVRTVILDEADEMLDMGFADDLDAILDALPADRQTVMFSATVPRSIEKVAGSRLRNPVRIEIEGGPADSAGSLIEHYAHAVDRHHKVATLSRVLDVESPEASLVFCKTRREVDELTTAMNGRGYRAEALHGGMDQAQRDRVMQRLRSGVVELLVATDVAARGIDVDVLTHVVNYDAPSSPETYVHRVGRVGRAGQSGVAITLLEPRQRRLLASIERHIGGDIPQRPVPSVADARLKQLGDTAAAIDAALTAEDLDDYRPILDALSGEAPVAVALAAAKVAHEARTSTLSDEEIPAPKKGKGPGNHKGNDRGRGRDDRGGRGRDGDGGRGGKGGRSSGGPTASIYVGLGKRDGVRPGDLVGAIANEAGLSGRDIGPIRISHDHAVVGVPESDVDRVVGAMKKATVRGKPASIRRFVE